MINGRDENPPPMPILPIFQENGRVYLGEPVNLLYVFPTDLVRLPDVEYMPLLIYPDRWRATA